MWLDAIALLVLGAFTALGALRGGLVAGMSLASLGAAYAAALLAAPRLGPALGRSAGLPEVLGLPIAGMAAFALVYGLMAVVTRVLARRRRRARRSPRDRFLGGVLGAVRGALVVLLLSWLALWVEALRTTGAVGALPELGSSHAADLTESVVEAGVTAAIDDESSSGRVVASIAARPDRAFTGLRSLLESPLVAELRDDALFWTYVEHGSVDTALNRASFVRLARDASLRQQFVDVGLVPAEAGDDAGVFRDSVRDVLLELAPHLAGLGSDPELQALLDDADLMGMLRAGDTAGLLGHRGFRELVAKVASR